MRVWRRMARRAAQSLRGTDVRRSVPRPDLTPARARQWTRRPSKYRTTTTTRLPSHGGSRLHPAPRSRSRSRSHREHRRLRSHERHSSTTRSHRTTTAAGSQIRSSRRSSCCNTRSSRCNTRSSRQCTCRSVCRSGRRRSRRGSHRSSRHSHRSCHRSSTTSRSMLARGRRRHHRGAALRSRQIGRLRRRRPQHRAGCQVRQARWATAASAACLPVSTPQGRRTPRSFRAVTRAAAFSGAPRPGSSSRGS